MYAALGVWTRIASVIMFYDSLTQTFEFSTD